MSRAAGAWPRQTLARPVALHGNAVRTHGGQVELRLTPGDAGLAFWRDDLSQRYPADLDHLASVPNATALGRAGQPEVLFVEHVLSALVGLGYTDAEIHLDGPEVPLFDGSAAPIVEALAEAGVDALPGAVEPLVLSEPLTIERDGRRITAAPADEASFEYHLAHAHPLIGEQVATAGWPDYAARVAPARTFATTEELAALAAAGLIKGGSEANLLVIYPDRLSAPLHSTDEFALHKVLDLMGDLALLGRPVQAWIRAERTGHSDNQALARALRATA